MISLGLIQDLSSWNKLYFTKDLIIYQFMFIWRTIFLSISLSYDKQKNIEVMMRVMTFYITQIWSINACLAYFLIVIKGLNLMQFWSIAIFGPMIVNVVNDKFIYWNIDQCFLIWLSIYVSTGTYELCTDTIF